MASENTNGLKCIPTITISKSSLIVVSNRLPFVLKKNAEGQMTRQARWVGKRGKIKSFNVILTTFAVVAVIANVQRVKTLRMWPALSVGGSTAASSEYWTLISRHRVCVSSNQQFKVQVDWKIWGKLFYFRIDTAKWHITMCINCTFAFASMQLFSASIWKLPCRDAISYYQMHTEWCSRESDDSRRITMKLFWSCQ